MGIEYALYHRPSKTFIELGKHRVAEDRFQIDPDKIAAFISKQLYTGEPLIFEVVSDSGNQPDDVEEGWKQVDGWDWVNGVEPGA